MDEELQQEDDEIILIKIAGHVTPIARSRIRWVEARRNYVRLHTENQSYLLRETLAHIEERWGSCGFVRIHRARLVFWPLVTDIQKRLSGHSARIGSGPDAVELPISRRHLKKIRQRRIEQHKHKR